MSKKLEFRDLLAEAKKGEAYWLEGAVLEFTEDMVARMAEQKVSRTDLARRIGCSPAYVTKILRGSTNFTLESMVKIARALGCEFRMHLQPDGRQTQWFDLFESFQPSAAYRDTHEMRKAFKEYSSCPRVADPEVKNDPLANVA